jgi:hypothetical protein
MDLYPEHDWKYWLFRKQPLEYWDSMENQRKFLEWVKEKLCITALDQWFDVSLDQLKHFGYYFFCEYYEGLS